MDLKRLAGRLRKDEEAPAGAVESNPNVVDLLAPGYLCESDDKVTVETGAEKRRMFYIRDYDSMIDIKWGEALHSQPESMTSYVMRPSNPERLRKAIDHSNARQGVTLVQGSSASKMEEAERIREHGQTMLRIMGDANERFFETMILESVAASDAVELRKRAISLKSLAGGRHLTMDECTRKQVSAWLAASPWCGEERDLWKRYGRDVCASTIAAAMPFSDSSLDDGAGVTLGVCKPEDSVCRIDTMRTSEERTNHNIIVLGESGAGKTFACSKILLSEWAQGARVMIVDPERQFRNACRSAHGQWINAGGGMRTGRNGRAYGSCFSPLQPRLGTFDDDGWDSDDFNDSAEVLRSTMSYFHCWAQIAWGVGKDDNSLMDDGLKAAYARYGIDFSTSADELEPDRYPLMDDLRECFSELADNESDPDRSRRYRHLADKAGQCGSDGIYGNLWSRRTNVDIKDDFVVFDTFELTDDKEAHIRTAQLFSIMSWIWTQACTSRSTGRFLRVMFDEGHMMFGGGSGGGANIGAAAYLNKMQKRIRKYNGGIMFATQQIGDVLSDEVRRYGESLITSSCYKLLLRTNGSDLDALADTAKLSPTVAAMIGADFKRGDCLLCAGTARSRIRIEALPFEVAFFNLDGSSPSEAEES